MNAPRDRIQDLMDENDALKAEVARRAAERDEARRDLCNLIGGFDVRRSRRAAKLRGWNCFEKEAKP